MPSRPPLGPGCDNSTRTDSRGQALANGSAVVCDGASDPAAPRAQGCHRLSRRHTDPARSAPGSATTPTTGSSPPSPAGSTASMSSCGPPHRARDCLPAPGSGSGPRRFSHRHAHKTVMPTPIAPIDRSCASTMVSQQIVITTHNGGSVRAYEVLGRSHSVRPGFAGLQDPCRISAVVQSPPLPVSVVPILPFSAPRPRTPSSQPAHRTSRSCVRTDRSPVTESSRRALGSSGSGGSTLTRHAISADAGPGRVANGAAAARRPSWQA